MKKTTWFTLTFAALFGIIAFVWAQEGSVVIKIVGSQRPAIAVPDLRGSGAAQNFMGAFNETLFGDLQNSGLFEMRPKGMYPLQVPQRPEEFRQPPRPGASLGGMALSDWSSPPVQANFLTAGYTAEQNGQIALYGWLFDVGQPNIINAQVVGKRYFGTLDEAGARKVAHEFASDILAHWGATSLFGTKIYFVSDRTGHKEVWSMDPDGSNQKQITSFKSISIMPAVSPDGSKIAFTSFARGNPAIFILSTETGRRLSFYNQVASLNATPDFTPDGKQILYASSASGYAQIYVANLDGSGLKRISSSRAIEVEPKVNPKTGGDIVFVSGRTGPQQIFRMNFDGTGVERLTNGQGEASNPSWNPDGQHIAFSWTRGYATGNFNLFLMDVATRQFDQLTHSEGRNENPSWAPDGRHLVFMSTRSGSHQIYTMLADGTQVHQLTTSGRNQTPVWENDRFVQTILEAEIMLLKRKWNVIWVAIVLVALVAFSSGCKKKAPPPPPPPPPVQPAPPPPPAPAPDITEFSAEPSTIERGQSSTLKWSVSNATEITIDHGVGTVQANGTKSVFPTETTTYSLRATGSGGTMNKTATVTVTAAAPPPPAPAAPKPSLSERVSSLQDAYFDYDKSDIREDARAALTKGAEALKSIFQEFPSAVISVEGHCDERGSAEYNLGLGDRRSTAAKDFLVQLGVPADKLKTISYGKERPTCTESNEECWQRNRRAHFSAGQ